jgi:hypothetical protein
MTLWANVHGTFFFGLGLTGFFGLEALIAAPAARRLAVVARWGGFGLAAAGAALINPHGLDLLLFPLKLTGMAALPSIVEWAPADFAKVEPLEIALVAGVFVALTRPLRLAPLRALLILLLVHLSLVHIRYEQLLGVVAALVLAAPLARAYDQAEAPAAAAPRSWLKPVTAGALIVALGLAGLRLRLPVAITDGATTPVSALAAVPAALRAQPVLNDYSFGGFLIGQQVRPYVDGRADLYGDAFLASYARLNAGDAGELSRVLAGRKVAWALHQPGSPMARAMQGLPGWRTHYADRWAVVEVKGP